jgi:predicted metal-dependent hydrolase
MAAKKIELAGIGTVTLVKLAKNRSIRLSVNGTGVRVSMPHWTAYSAGAAFAVANQAWIQQELTKHQTTRLESGQAIGKIHHLYFEQVLDGRAPTSRVTGTGVFVRLQIGESIEDPAVQERATKAAVRALKREAEQLLPPRLAAMAARHDLSYKSVDVKLLKRRWGSCSSEQAITLNLYLMELPWEYIDYVLCHELAHTHQMNHGPEFWSLLTSLNPAARDLSKRLRKHQPQIGNWQPVAN